MRRPAPRGHRATGPRYRRIRADSGGFVPRCGGRRHKPRSRVSGNAVELSDSRAQDSCSAPTSGSRRPRRSGCSRSSQAGAWRLSANVLPFTRNGSAYPLSVHCRLCRDPLLRAPRDAGRRCVAVPRQHSHTGCVVFDFSTLPDRMQRIDTSPVGNRRGKALEQLVSDMFSALPGVEVADRNVVSGSGEAEFDVLLVNERREDGVPGFDRDVLIECKSSR